jgi:hypothetical protein
MRILNNNFLINNRVELKISTLLLFLSFPIILFSQTIKIPFYEPFESNLNNWQIQEEKYGRVKLDIIDESYRNSLKIMVYPNDKPAIKDKNDERSRTEIALLNHEINDGDNYFYSWDLFIPTNQNFTKFTTSVSENYYVIMQWHEAGDGVPTYCLKGDNIRTARAFPLTLRLVPTSLDKDLKMDLHLKYGTTYGPGNSSNDGDICPQDPHSKGYREHIIDKAIKMGEWNHIVMQIKWSIEGSSAFIRMWINDLPVINDNNIQQYKRNEANPDLYLGRENVEASILGGVPLLYTRMENGVEIVEKNYQKLGHYRKNYNSVNTIIVDNYRITSEYPPKPFTTCLTDNFCNKELSLGENYPLETYEISPVDNYLFHFEEDLTQTSNEVTNYNHILNLVEEKWVRAGKTYNIKVRALNDLNNGRGFEFGKTCKVTIPERTRLFDIYSSENSSSPYTIKKNESIYNYPLPGATDYLFKIKNVQDSSEIWVPGNGKDINSLNLSKISGIKENTTYQISLKASRIDNGKDVYAHLKTGEYDFIKVNKTVRNLDKRVKINLNPSAESVHIQSKTKLKSIYLISHGGEILLKYWVDLKETRLDLSPFKNQVYQIVAVDKKRNIYSLLLNTDAL